MSERITIGDFQAETIDTTNKKCGPLIEELGYRDPRLIESYRFWQGDARIGDFRLYEVDRTEAGIDRVVFGPYVMHSKPFFVDTFDQETLAPEERDHVPAATVLAFLQAKADFKSECDNYGKGPTTG